MRKKSEVLEKILSSISEKDITECRDRMFLAVLLDEYRREKNISLNDLAQYLHITDEEMGEIIAGNKDMPVDYNKEFLDEIIKTKL
jgi:predicted HTH domain antitoxin